MSETAKWFSGRLAAFSAAPDRTGSGVYAGQKTERAELSAVQTGTGKRGCGFPGHLPE